MRGSLYAHVKCVIGCIEWIQCFGLLPEDVIIAVFWRPRGAGRQRLDGGRLGVKPTEILYCKLRYCMGTLARTATASFTGMALEPCTVLEGIIL